jgi:hypothetical protein
MVARTAGRKGRPFRRDQAALRKQPDICAWCGHEGGANETDHRTNRVDGGHNGLTNYQRMHGSSSPCPTCGLCCNQVKYHAERRAMRAQAPPQYSRW